ncbi:MAG: sulfite exporter TauE/SafE family protein [Gammaproteobacteria bacterium]|nr:MAG: sulfite exporter TauE/SafE family protein [Gammaproteobacteria bacterium]
MFEFSATSIFLIGLLFVWTGFVRSGLGFGGAALGLPLMLFIHDQPLFWLPVIGTHLLFFSSMTLRTRINNVDWDYLKKSGVYIIPAALAGVFGLINLPNNWLLIFIYSITLLYAVMWLFNISIHSDRNWLDGLLLTTGGYVAGTSLTGAPLMVAVYMRNVAANQLRNTLFVLWFILVTIKMTTFAVLGVKLHFMSALVLLPVAAIGHIVGLRAHEFILQNDPLFKRVVGGVLLMICLLGLWKMGL